ncbi:MAG TPA: TIGR03086 family metal-binding protein [Acidimicrobiales bacterium]|nr:TIGR03086 family metal-binding protein [Acidimicrobiales bacterium]
MAIELPEAHARALDATRVAVAGVRPDQWDTASVCDQWSVRELVNHLVAGNWWVAPLVEGRTIEQVGDRYDGDVLGDDPLAAYDASTSSAAAAFRSPGAMDAPVAVSYGPVPGSVYCGHRLIDVLVHGWDVAASTGQPTALDPELVTAALEVAEPQIDLLAASGMFGTRAEASAGASDEQHLLAMLGRA